MAEASIKKGTTKKSQTQDATGKDYKLEGLARYTDTVFYALVDSYRVQPWRQAFGIRWT